MAPGCCEKRGQGEWLLCWDWIIKFVVVICKGDRKENLKKNKQLTEVELNSTQAEALAHRNYWNRSRILSMHLSSQKSQLLGTNPYLFYR